METGLLNLAILNMIWQEISTHTTHIIPYYRKFGTNKAGRDNKPNNKSKSKQIKEQ